MKDRQKIIVTAVAIGASLLVTYFIVRFAVLNQAEEYDDNITRLRGEISKLKNFNKLKSIYDKKFEAYAARTLGLVTQGVSEQIRSRLDKMVATSGMRRSQTASVSITGSPTIAYQEIGWKYDLIGTLQQVVKMMYLLKNDPYLHQIQGFSVSPMKEGDEFKLGFSYVTLVLQKDKKNKKEKIITGDVENPKPIASLTNNKTLSLYDGIAERNFFRPFIKKTTPPPKVASATTKPKTPEKDWKKFKIVSLSLWGKKQDIRIENIQTGENKRYNIGDSLVGGKIVMVDYRKLPKPTQPEMLSYSRAIFKIGQVFYAVELGETLGDKYQLTGQKIPPALREKPK